MQSLNFESPEQFISDLVKASLQMRAQSEAQAEALEQAAGVAVESGVEVTVAPGGELTGIRFLKELDSTSEAILSNAAMRAYEKASELANRATAEAVVDPEVSQSVLDAVPEEIAQLRDNDDAPVAAQPLEARDGLEDRLYTVDDLPPDPNFDEVLAALDADDPVRAVRELGDQGRVTLVETTKPAADIEAEIVAELEAVSAQATELGPELRSIRATGENEAARIKVGAWGRVYDLEIRPPGMKLEPEELADEILAAARLAGHEASKRVQRLLAGTDFADEEDPSVGAQLRDREDQ